MECRENFPVELLDDGEAWQLFKKMSRDNIEGRAFEPVAREVAKKCARLPIVIVTVARALSRKNLFEWRNASQRLGLSSPANIQHIHASIELSFNYLETEQLKKTILLIAYADIKSIDKLLIYGMGVALFEDVDKMERRRDRVLTLVQQLKDSCLLLDSNTGEEDFSMHDVVLEVAMSIASRDPQVFTKIQSVDENALKVCHSIVLKDVTTGELPQVLESQHLKLLSISRLDSCSIFCSQLHDDFFIRMTELKVLVLDSVELLSLPSSLRFLTNLRALGLYDCRLGDIANIGDLKELEILSLNDRRIRKLPVEVGHLARLKSLDLRGCIYLEVIARSVLSSLSHLEELYMGYVSRWENEGPNKGRKNISLDELTHLSNLTCLQIKLQYAKALPRDLPPLFNKLERYQMEIGWSRTILNEDWILKSCRKFSLSLIDTNICLNDGHIMQLTNIEVLCLEGSQDMKNVLYGLDRDGFQQLKYLQVTDNDKLLCIVEPMMRGTKNAFPVLEILVIHKLIKLEKICHGQLITESSFSQLRKIQVKGCARLGNIFSLSIARRLQQLQSIKVRSCENMTEIFAIEREDESSCNISEVIDNFKLSQLRSLTLRDLPQLKSLEYNSNCSNTLLSGKVVLPSLEVLMLVAMNVERIWENSVAATSCGIQNLTELTLRNCRNLKWLFSTSMIGSFDQLKYLEIWECPALEEIMVIDDKDELRKEGRKNNVAFSICNINNDLEMFVSDCNKLKTLFRWHMYRKFLRLKSLSVWYCNLLEVIFDLEDPDFNDERSAVTITQLSKLHLQDLPKLKQIWNKDPKSFVSFEKLKEVSIGGCDVLKNIFPASIAKSLSQLESLHISKCGVEEIVFVAEEEAETNSRFVFPRLISLTLRELPKFTTFFSGRYTAERRASFLTGEIFPNLEKLSLQGKSISTLWEFSGDFTYKMRCLDIDLTKSIVTSSLDFLQRFHSIEKLKIEGAWDFRFTDEKDVTSIIRNCSDLKYILKEESNMDHLIHLEVKNCANLVNLLVPSLTSFQNLTTLVVSGCDALTNIVTASTAKSMGQLREIKIMACDKITEFLLADEGDDTKDNEIVFDKLEKLHLQQLKGLTSFCSASYTLKFPSLEDLIVIICFQMKSFSKGNLSTPKLQKVNYGTKCWKGDLNATIQQLYEKEMCKRHQLKMTGKQEDIPSSSNNVQMMCSDNDEVDMEDEIEEDVIGSSNMQMMCSDSDEVDTEDEDEIHDAQSSEEDSG